MIKKRIIWFSKRAPFIEQNEELKKILGGGDITTDILMKEARLKFESMIEVVEASTAIFQAVKRALADGISPKDIILAGSFPPALMENLLRGNKNGGREIRILASWNCKKTTEDGRDFYLHKKFCEIGKIIVQE